jgi:hypothetical protein
MEILVEQKENEGLRALLGKRVTLFCCRYIYTGKLIGINDNCVKLTECGIVYDTGDFKSTSWNDYQELPNDFYIQTSAIESFGILK